MHRFLKAIRNVHLQFGKMRSDPILTEARITNCNQNVLEPEKFSDASPKKCNKYKNVCEVMYFFGDSIEYAQMNLVTNSAPRFSIPHSHPKPYPE